MFREWVMAQIRIGNVGYALATGEFDHDGYDDLAIGAARDSVVGIYKENNEE
jgi:hypothetical protein